MIGIHLFTYNTIFVELKSMTKVHILGFHSIDS
jgi:hypothetical protein